VLEITDNRVALRRLDDDEKGEYTIPTPGGLQKVSIVNESGMYSLVLTSRKPEAKAFLKWINSRTTL
jgi:prophage antirepressor-like protein